MSSDRPKKKATVEVEYGPQYAEGTRRAGAVLRRLIARAAEQAGYRSAGPPTGPPPPKPGPFTEDDLRKRPRYRGGRGRGLSK